MTFKLAGLLTVLALAAGAIGLAGAATEGDGPVARAAYKRPASIPFPDGNPYSAAKAELGRSLFFDPILSDTGDRSCASCHRPNAAWGDGQARAARRDHQDSDLRTPTLLNVAWAEGPLGWDGKFPALEAVAFGPITAPGNMNLPEAELVRRLGGRPDYVTAFAEAFPGTPADAPVVTRKRIEDALATFERLIVSPIASFDRWVAGDKNAVSPQAKRGFALFNGKAGCAACHSGWTFTDGSFHDIGTAKDGDIGRGRRFPSAQALRYAFKTPTLRDVARRAPYMHDGGMPTLAAVIDLYDRGGIDRPSRSRDIRPLNLRESEKADLLAFLQTLDSESFDRSILAALTPHSPVP